VLHHGGCIGEGRIFQLAVSKESELLRNRRAVAA